MKKNKTIVSFAALCLLLISCLLFVFACGASAEKTADYTDYQDAYEWNYEKQYSENADSDMKIDGALTEARWQNKKWLTHVEQSVSLKYTTAFTQKGLYIAAVAKDSKMQWNAARAFLNNSSFRFYIVSNKADSYFTFNCISFYIDQYNSACRQQTRFDAGAAKTEEDGIPVLTAEFFATWEDLNYQVDEASGLPQFAKIVPMYRYVDGFQSANNTFLKPTFAEVDNDRVNNALKFDGDGYINTDAENAELGNAANGFAKSDGWDISDVTGGEDGIKTVKTTVEHGQAIYFKNIYSERYFYSVDMKISGGLNGDEYPSAGVLDMKSTSEFNCMRITGRDYLNSGKKTLNYYLLDFYVNPWHDTLYGSRTEAESSDVINIKVFKDNTKYYYVLNGKYAFSEELDWLGGKSCPGLYSLGCEVEFSNWSATDFSGEEKTDAFNSAISEYMNVISVPERVSGGSLVTDKLATAKQSDEAVALTVRANRGYMLTDITVNDESIFEQVISEIENSKFNLTGIDKSYSVKAVFTALPSSDCIRVTGFIKRSTSEPVINMNYSVNSTDSGAGKLLSTAGVTTSSGTFDVLLLKAGTYQIGGRTIESNGIYKIEFDGIFPFGENNIITIDTNDAKFDGVSVYKWENIVLNPYSVVNMKLNEDGSVQTTNTSYNEKNSYLVFNETYTGSFSVSSRIVATNDKWPCYGFTVIDEYNSSMQFFAAGPAYYRVMANYGDYVQKSGASTFVNGICDFKLFYDQYTKMFAVYANGVLLTKVKRDSSMTGDTFKIGVTGYMSGADGSYDTVTESNPFAKFTNITVEQFYSIDAPKEAEITVNGAIITDGKIPVNAEVKVSVPVDPDKTYIIFVNGNAEVTSVKDGKATATFTANGNISVTYKVAYKISGKVSAGNKYGFTTDLSQVTVSIVNGEGTVLYSGKSDGEGNFEAYLADGTYYVTAESDKMVSDAVMLTVEDGNVDNLILFLEKPKINSYISSDQMTYDFKTGYYNSSFGQTNNGGYLEGASVSQGNSFVVKAQFIGMSADTWPSAGIIIGTDAEHAVRFAIRQNGTSNDKYDFILLRYATGSDPQLYLPVSFTANSWMQLNPFGEDKKQPLTIAVVYYNENYYVYFNDELAFTFSENTKFLNSDLTLKYAIGETGNKKLGLFAERAVSFADWDYSKDINDISGYLGRTLTLSEGMTATVNGKAVTDGKVMLGDTVTITKEVNENEIYSFIVDGNAIETVINGNKATAQFTVTGNCDVTYTLAYAVSGNIADGSGMTVTIINQSGATVYNGSADEYGAFSANLAVGTYYATAENEQYVTDAVSFTVSDDGSYGTISLKTFKPKSTVEVGSMFYDRKTGYYTVQEEQAYDNRGYFAAAEGKSFVLETELKIGTNDWTSAGAAFKNGTSTARFVFRLNGDKLYDCVLFVDGRNAVVMSIPIEGIQQSAFSSGWLKMALVYKDGTYYIFFNGEKAFSLDAATYGLETFAQSGAKLGICSEQKATFKSWSYSSDITNITTYLGRTITLSDGMTATVNGKAVTDGKVMLGDTVTITKEANENEIYSFIVDGNAIETVINGNKATAQFAVTGNCDVTYTLAYAVSGNIADGSGMTVTIINQSGATVYNGSADEYGAFSANLAVGTYYATAENEQYVTDAVSFTVSDDGSYGTISLKTFKPKSTVEVGSMFYDRKTGYYKTVESDTNNRAYYASVEQYKAFAAEITVKDIGGQWPSVGFILTTGGENYIKFVVRKNTDGGYFDFLVWGANSVSVKNFNNSDIKANPFSNTDSTMKMTLVYSQNCYFIYINDIFFWSFEQDADVGNGVIIQNLLGQVGDIKIGLFAERQITFADWDFTTDSEAVSEYID